MAASDPTTSKPKSGERIAKVLARAGIASRREAERMIELGQVSVNGAVITSPALNVTPADRITVNGKPLAEPEQARLWLYYKPLGLVTSERDEKGRDTVFANLPADLPRVLSIGRLDLNSEGLLLLTNDGEIKRRLELPSTGWLRKYRVRVNGQPTDDLLEPLRKGLTVEGERFQGMTVTIDKIQGANAWLTVGIREGKNREIRRAINHVGLIVNRLIRVSYGPFKLADMQPGQVEEVKARVLRDQLGLAAPTEAPKPKLQRTRTAAALHARRAPNAPHASDAPYAPQTRDPSAKSPRLHTAISPVEQAAKNAPAKSPRPRSGTSGKPGLKDAPHSGPRSGSPSGPGTGPRSGPRSGPRTSSPSGPRPRSKP